MRTVTKTFEVYEFDELSDIAKSNARVIVRYHARLKLNWPRQDIDNACRQYQYLSDGTIFEVRQRLYQK